MWRGMKAKWVNGSAFGRKHYGYKKNEGRRIAEIPRPFLTTFYRLLKSYTVKYGVNVGDHILARLF